MHKWLRRSEDIRSIEYLPEYWADVAEIKALVESEDEEFRQLNDKHSAVLDDAFVETAGEQAITRRERMLQIRADRTMESLEFRRARLINRYSMREPFTIRWLERMLIRLCGRAAIERDVNAFSLEVEVGDDFAQQKELWYTLEQTVPLDMGILMAVRTPIPPHTLRFAGRAFPCVPIIKLPEIEFEYSYKKSMRPIPRMESVVQTRIMPLELEETP